MPQKPTTITDEIGIAFGNLADAASSPFQPTIRLGVTGLSRSGKTVFITALVHALLSGGRLPGFAPVTEGRLIAARLGEYPDAAMPRFAYEQHLAALTAKTPHWPESTRRISQLRVSIRYQSALWYGALFGPATLNIDIVDYPGEWLLDLPLLSLGYREWSEQALARAEKPHSRTEAERFLNAVSATDALADATEPEAERLASTFTDYLRQSRADGRALSALPPGRFLMPGDLEGSPALTFAPLPPQPAPVRSQSLYAMLERRYEAYKDVVVRPFFRDHFARLDRQIVLVDTLRAMNAGPEAVRDLETALSDVLRCFRQGGNGPLEWLVARKIDRILFAATKADHLHSTSHGRLESVMNRLVAEATRLARFRGAETRSLAIASVRATREGSVEEDGEAHEVIIGTPEKGETLDGRVFDGRTEIALFPGDLPVTPESLLEEGRPAGLRFLRFLPPGRLERNPDGSAVMPHIRLDRAIDWLIGDKLR